MSRQRPRKRSASAVPGAAAAVARPTTAWRWGAPLLIVVAGLASYANSLHGPFLLDDQRAIVQNQTIRQLSPIGTPLHPPRQSPVTGRPLANLTFAVNYAIGGFGVEGFHAGNVVIHVLAALALFGVFRLTFARTPMAGGGSRPAWLALTGALVWTVHPLNSEAVNYITQRTELLMGLGVFVTLYASIRAHGPRGRRWEWVAAAAAFCAVASKETALTLPILVVLWDRVFVFATLREAWTRRRRPYALVASSWLLFAYFARELPFFVERGFEQQVSRATYLLHQTSMVMHYLRLAVWPNGLVFDYGPVSPVAIGAVWPSLVAVLVLMGATMLALVRAPAFGYWAAWFWITLAPPSSLIPIPTEVGAERRMYVPLIGLVAIGVLGASAALQRLPTAEWRRRVAFTTAAIVVVAMGALTAWRNVVYASGLAIWQDVLDHRPHARAHEHISMQLRDAGRIDESIEHLRAAAVESPAARHALASALLERGELAESIAQFREFVTQNPASRAIVSAREEFAVALTRAGDEDGAIEQLRAVTVSLPDYARGRVALADALARRNDVDAAMQEYRQALRIQPNNVVALARLGAMLGSRGEDAEAITLLRRAVELEPRALPPRRQIVQLLAKAKDFAAMEREAALLLTHAPGDPDAHNLLGIALASQQRLEPAAEQFAEAVRLAPSHEDAKANLARVRALAARQVR